MAQARLDGYARDPLAYHQELLNYSRKREAVLLGIARSHLGNRSVAGRLQDARDREILRLLRGAPASRFAPDVYGRFVGSCADHGWPIVGYRRFVQYLERLEMLGRVILQVQSFGRGGRRTTVMITRMTGNAEVAQGGGLPAGRCSSAGPSRPTDDDGSRPESG